MKKVIFIFVSLVLFSTLVSAFDWNDQITSYWNFNENTGTKAVNLVNTSLNLTLQSGIRWNATGIIGSMVESTGGTGINNKLNITNNRFNNTGNSMSISFWYKPLQDSYAVNTYILANEANFGFQQMAMDAVGGVPNINNTIQAFVNGNTFNGTANILAGPVLSPNSFYYITFTMNATNAKLYINGAVVNSSAGTYSIGSTANGLTLLNREAGDLYNNASIDELGMWNRMLTPEDVAQLYNDGDGLAFGTSPDVVINSPLNNSFLIQNPQPFNVTFSPNAGINLTNLTIRAYNGGILTLSNTTTITGNTSNNTIIYLNMVPGVYLIEGIGCQINLSGSHICVGSSTGNITVTFGSIFNTFEYTNPSYPGASDLFRANISISSSTNITSAFMYYENISYLGTVSLISGTNYTLSRTITLPNSSGIKSFFWSINFANGGQVNSSVQTQLLNDLAIDNCTINNQQIFNFSLFDEDTRVNYINGTLQLAINFYNTQRTVLTNTFNRSYTLSETAKSARVCWTPTNGTYSVDYQAFYQGNSSYDPEYKFAQNITLTNGSELQNVALYDLLSSRSQEFSITLQNYDLSLLSGVIIDVQRSYPALDQFISVESPLTDTTGVTIAHLVPQEQYYNFVVSKNGQLLGTFNNYLVQCQNIVIADCRITLNLIQSTPPIDDFSTYGNVTTNFQFDQPSRVVTLNFITADSNVHTVGWNVSLNDNYRNNTICSSALTGTSGTIMCTIPSSYGNSSISISTYSDGNLIGNQGFYLGSPAREIFGGVQVILGLLMYSTLVLLMIGEPVMMILGSVVGMIFLALFHIVDLSSSGGSLIGNSSIILWFVIAAIIIIFKMNRRI